MKIHAVYQESTEFMSDNPETRFMTEKEDSPSLEDAQAFVGGTVEIHHIYLKGRPVQLFFNEDGRSLNLPKNHLASLITNIELVGNVAFLFGKARWK